jgi:hypothetical protein
MSSYCNFMFLGQRHRLTSSATQITNLLIQVVLAFAVLVERMKTYFKGSSPCSYQQGLQSNASCLLLSGLCIISPNGFYINSMNGYTIHTIRWSSLSFRSDNFIFFASLLLGFLDSSIYRDVHVFIFFIFYSPTMKELYADWDGNNDLSCTTNAGGLPSSSLSYGRSTKVKGVLQVEQGNRLKEIPKQKGKARHPHSTLVLLLQLLCILICSSEFSQ